MDKSMRLLENAWNAGNFPHHLKSLEIKNLRGWNGQHVDFNFPIVAIVGENGMGKSTIIQAAASIYKAPANESGFFASDFFPDTAWEELSGVEINATIKQGSITRSVSIKKRSKRWRGNDLRCERAVRFIDLRRIIPIYSKSGYSKIAKRNVHEQSSTVFDDDSLRRLSAVIGKQYTLAKQATTDVDATRTVPVLKTSGDEYSGFHQGAGESVIAELIALDIPNNSLVLIDEVETSLHPSAQRRLIRNLAELSRKRHVQFIVTTHSPYVLDELPNCARIQVISSMGEKVVVSGVSSNFALSCMDDVRHTEVDLYVEDDVAKILVEEIIAQQDLSLLKRVQIIPFGSAQVGKSLGQMVQQHRFTRPSLVYLDGDQSEAVGCYLLPGNDAPERQIYEDLAHIGWPDVATSIARSHAELVNVAQREMVTHDHHLWNNDVADQLSCGGYDLWRAMCRSWVKHVFVAQGDTSIVDNIKDMLGE